VKVISTCLFDGHRHTEHEGIGDRHPFYWTNALHVIAMAKYVFPGWEFWLYSDDALLHERGEVFCHLHGEGHIKLMHTPPPLAEGDSAKMLWRLLPAYEPHVDHFICRDLDSPLVPRDAACVNAWLQTGLAAHVIRDHPYHSVSFLGGTCGFRPRHFNHLTGTNTLAALVAKLGRKRGVLDKHVQGDQVLLNQVVWPAMVGKVCEHSFCGLVRNSMNPRPPTPEMPEHLPPPAQFLDEMFPTIGMPYDCARAEEWICGMSPEARAVYECVQKFRS
jgi:hypothetical protein